MGREVDRIGTLIEPEWHSIDGGSSTRDTSTEARSFGHRHHTSIVARFVLNEHLRPHSDTLHAGMQPVRRNKPAELRV
jgi:hypothetical protein